MNQALKAQEPSMEEILASIRRIIADDEAAKPAASAAKAEPPRPAPIPAPPSFGATPSSPPTTRDLMEALDEPRETVSAEPPMFRQPAPAAASTMIDPLDALEAEIAATAMAAPERTAAPLRDDRSEMRPAFEDTPATAAVPVVHDEFEEEPYRAPANEPALLSHQASEAVNSAFSALAHTMLAHNTERLDDMARQMLRPMLKAWLDDNLPTIVERLVRGEIERVSRGR